MPELGGMLAAALLKVVGDQIGSLIGGQIMLQKNLSKDLEKMKMALESVEALLDDAETRSITDEPTRLWLKRLKVATYAISDMIDEFNADTQAIVQPSKQKFSVKNYLALMVPSLKVGPKIKLANKMKTMRVDLDEITAQHKDFNLLANTNAAQLNVHRERETSSKSYEQIFGRTEERETILASLSKSTGKEITILPIYGIGGLGKTTLAQMVYSSSLFHDFSRVWVYVSQTFDLMKIGNSIISQLSEKESQYTEMQMIDNSLSKLFAGKKILIVLDDLWEDNKIDLQKLKGMLNVGNGSNVVVVVTTRSEGIAMEVSTIQPHKLAQLSNGLCWSIIKHKSAFKSRDDKKELKHIGKEIASKCGGVALAAQSLGYLLQSMTSRQWKLVKDSDIWSMPDSEEPSFTHILASLRLSYSAMPAYLKLCFAYCAIFPKGHKIVKDDLIQQWIALDFVKSTDLYTSWELGDIYISQLVGLSFLRNSESPFATGVHLEDVAFFTMHDLVHDLARSVMVDEIVIPDKQGNTAGSCYRYALLDDCSKQLKPSKIRALRFMDCGEIELDGAAFSSAKSLRVLDLSECSIHKLPDSIGVLKQLRYLNAPRIQNTTIPDSITSLSMLTYLNLHGSAAISALPESIGDIEGLLHIDLSGCSNIDKLPVSMERLTKLVHLDLSNCSRVGDISKFLGGLQKLQYLNVSHCPNIGELPKELGSLSELQYLNLSFSSYLKCCQEKDSLSTLTKGLKLSSGCCKLRSLREAFSSFDQLKYLNLSGCQHRKELLKLFGNLKSLLHLDLSYCRHIIAVPEALVGLTKLQYLNLSHQYLEPGPFSAIAPKILDDFMESISTLFNLEHLDLANNQHIRNIPESFCNLRKLHILDLSYCNSLHEIPESIGTIDSLKFLNLDGCRLWSKLPELSSSTISLPHFAVKADDGEYSSNLSRLRETNPVMLMITRLENVKSAEEADCIELMEKQRLTDLTLEWTRDAERFVDDKMLLEKLVPPSTLKILRIRGYTSGSLPAWLVDTTRYLPDLISLEMSDMPKCNIVPPLSQLPNLTYLVLSGLKSLEEWDTSCSSGEGHVMEQVKTNDCPRLRFKPLPPRAKRLEVSNSNSVLSSWVDYTGACTSSCYPVATTTLHVEDCELPMDQWRLLQHLSGLTSLWITGCGDLSGSPQIIQQLSSLISLGLFARDQEELPEWLGELTSLHELEISECSGLKELHESMRLLTKLQSLQLSGCSSIASLPHWLGELTSLERLMIWGCDAIKSLPEGIQQLTNLQKLVIYGCPALTKWCELEENETKLAHIKYKEFDTI